MQMLRAYSPGGSTFLLHEMTSLTPSWKWDVKSKIWLCR